MTVDRMRRATVAVLALCWMAAGTARGAPVDAGAPAGTLVIAGGAVRADNADVWNRVVALAGGAGARIAVMPAAAGNPLRSGEQLAAILRRYGAAPFVVPIAPRLEGSDFRQAAEDTALAQRIREAGGVYFAGGDQARITQALVRPDGSRTAALQAVWDVYGRGGVIAGSSAGAAVMSSTMFDEAPAVLESLRLGIQTGKSLAPGLGFIGEQVFIDQHFLVRGRLARMVPAMMSKGYKLGIGVDENSAVVVRQRREVEVIGYKGALLVDLSEAAPAPAGGAFGVRNAKISYLDHGDRYDLSSAVHVPGPDKEAGMVPGAPTAGASIYSNDILGNNAVLDLMERLVESGAEEAVGLASGDARAAVRGTGYAFRFTRTAATRAYPSSESQAVSLRQVRLDIEAVRP